MAVHEIQIYHGIRSNKSFWGDEDEMTPDDFANLTKDAQSGDEVNIYVNSPGGEVFAAATIISIIQRLQYDGVTVNAYIDGLAASAASFLVMACNTIQCYNNSMLMIHKPITFAIGNAEDFLSEAELLEKIENSTMLPLYMKRTSRTEDEIKQMLANETWMDAEEMSDVFGITIIDSNKVTDAIPADRFRMFKHTPDCYLHPENLTTADAPKEQEENINEAGNNEPDKGYYELLEGQIAAL